MHMPGAAKVLIVEDDVTLLAEPWKITLSREGYDVVGIAESGKQAVAMALEHKPSVVMMDITLSDGQKAGLEAARKIQEAYNAQIVYITSIQVDPLLLDEVGATRDFQFLTKPLTDKQILSSVRLGVMKAQGKRIVFLCYGREDRSMAEEWLKHMAPLKEFGIDSWDDSKIGLGRPFKIAINEALESSAAAVCLLSPSFVKSEFIMRYELPKLLQSARERGKAIIPVYVTLVPESKLKKTELMEFHGINQPEDPIDQWTRHERNTRCWGPLCKRLRTEMK